MKDEKTEPKDEPKKEETIEEPKEEFRINFMELLNDPMAKELLGGCKQLFKKEKADPNICEISIKAPSEVVLKLFGITNNE